MPTVEQGFSLEKLKSDPKMWMRLAMPSKNGNSLESVFKGKENPLEKNDQAAVETIQKLAAEGKLYLRDFGRSRHFHKVEKDGEKLKLGNQQEMKFSNSTADPVLGGLMWLSRAWFKWIGLNGISNWFDKRLKHRAELQELNSRYKEEYSSLTKEEKKELKALRKHEKNLNKLEKAQKEAEKTQRELDKARGIDTTKAKGEMDSPLSQPPELEQDKNTMQPTLLGDKPVQNQIPVPPKLEASQIPQKTDQQENTGVKKEEPQPNEKKSQLFIEGKEVTAENINQFPPHIVEAFRVIQRLIIEQEANKRENQQPVQEQPVVNENNEQQLPPAEGNAVQQENQQEQNLANNDVQANANDNAVQADMSAPLNNPPDLEQGQVNIQERPREQEQPTLQERLAAEREAMASVNNWENRLVNTLFSHEEGSLLREYYDMIKDKQEGTDFLAGAVCGILSTGAADPESSKQIMEGLLSGKPLGNEHNDRINAGVTAYNNAIEKMKQGNREPLEKLITDAASALGRQASQENGLSPRHAMIGRMISNAMSLADQYELPLKFDDTQKDIIRGAFQLSKLAEKHHAAKQLLGQENGDLAVSAKRTAVRDLLLGNAVENMIKLDKSFGQDVANTQLLMGRDYMNVDNLTKMMKATTIRKTITDDQLQNILEKPDSYNSAKIAKKLGDELLDIAQTGYDVYEQDLHRRMQNEMGLENEQQIQAAQLAPPA